MDLPKSWLKEFVDINVSDEEFCERITLSGSKIESVKKISGDISGVVVGKIVEIKKHPNADKLVICHVDIGGGANGLLQIVTGAANVFEGAFIPVARHGATLAGGLKIKKGRIRGEASQGMLCSITELGFTTHDYPEADPEGIYIFTEPQTPGADPLEILQMRDVVFEFEITSNRPDCFSILGLAREAAATFDVPLKTPEIFVKEEAGGSVNDFIRVQIKNPELCNRYAARVVKNIKVAPSPLWLRSRLTACGVRPINNIVDITNYVMLELGQPMHAFDLDLVSNSEIIVRTAGAGEKFTTLDGIERALDDSALVIADDTKAIAVAGVMGGENSKVTPGARAILLESANFEPVNTRLTSKKLGLRTDASGIFEKGIDPNLAETAVNRAAQLIEALGAGEVVSGVADCYPVKRAPWEVKYSPDNINKLLGTQISAGQMEKYLARLDIETKNGAALIKTFRPDLKIEADIAEEVARLFGYDNIPVTLASGGGTPGRKNRAQTVEDAVKESMVAQGLCEAMSYSFESPKVFDKLFLRDRAAVTIVNPLGEDFSVMRTQALNAMLNSLSINYNRRNPSARLFELAKIYIPNAAETLPDEILTLTLGEYPADFFTVKGYIENLFDRLGIGYSFNAVSSYPFLHPGRSAEVFIGEVLGGYVGEVHPRVLQNYDIGARVCVASLNAEIIKAAAVFEKTYKPLPKFPGISRDIAFIVRDEITVGEITDLVKKSGGKYLESVLLFDIYRGEKIGGGFKSLAFNIFFRSAETTLKDSDIEENFTKIIKNAEEKFNAKIRG